MDIDPSAVRLHDGRTVHVRPISDSDGDALVRFHEGQGAGTELLERLAHRARADGITRLVADTLSENHRMRDVFHHCDLASAATFEAGVVHVVLSLV